MKPIFSLDPLKSNEVLFQKFENPPLVISRPDAFSVVWFQHYGEAAINFEINQYSGNYLIFLCPEEILEIKDYQFLKVVHFSATEQVKEMLAFKYAYGNVTKSIALPPQQSIQIEALFQKIEHYLDRHNLITPELSSILLELIKTNPLYQCNQKYDIDTLLFDFITLVHEHYKMHHEMQFYAKKLLVPAKRIAEKFKSYGTMTPHEFIKNRILIEAKRQLLFTNKTSRFICFDIGFNDPAYFSRFFKLNTGMTAGGFKSNYDTSIA